MAMAKVLFLDHGDIRLTAKRFETFWKDLSRKNGEAYCHLGASVERTQDDKDLI